MDRSSQITLLSATYETDDIGQELETLTETTVFCDVRSISRDEFFEAGRNGLNPAFQVTMNRYEYNGEKECIYNDVKYGIYRSYVGRGENIELYLEKKTGVQ